MNDIDKIAYAQKYIQSLANGLDPISNCAVSDNDIVNNVRVSRCLFYVSDILKKLVDNNGTIYKKSKDKSEFKIDNSKLLEFKYSDKPIPISKITESINELIDTEEMRKLKYKSITKWLIDIGMLEEICDEYGKMKKRPTKAGNDIGIQLEHRMGLHKTYDVVIYDLNAQHFLIDNMEAISSINNSKD